MRAAFNKVPAVHSHVQRTICSSSRQLFFLVFCLTEKASSQIKTRQSASSLTSIIQGLSRQTGYRSGWASHTVAQTRITYSETAKTDLQPLLLTPMPTTLLNIPDTQFRGPKSPQLGLSSFDIQLKRMKV